MRGSVNRSNPRNQLESKIKYSYEIKNRNRYNHPISVRENVWFSQKKLKSSDKIGKKTFKEGQVLRPQCPVLGSRAD